jgi:hypothetical protein
MKRRDAPKVGLAVRFMIYALCEVLGMPIKFILTDGQEAACKPAILLLLNVKTSAVLAVKGYDTSELHRWLKGRGNISRHSAKIEPKRKNCL